MARSSGDSDSAGFLLMLVLPVAALGNYQIPTIGLDHLYHISNLHHVAFDLHLFMSWDAIAAQFISAMGNMQTNSGWLCNGRQNKTLLCTHHKHDLCRSSSPPPSVSSCQHSGYSIQAQKNTAKSATS